MLTLAQLIKVVLDEAYQDIPGTTAEKDKAIKSELERLSANYGDLKNSKRVAIDYSSAVARFAYIYKYTVAHADYIKQVIESNKALRDLFTRTDVAVACLGGGPGSDLLGILKYMIKAGSKSALTCYLFDRERAWGDSWSEVAKTLKATFPLFPVFQQMDVTDKTTWEGYKKFLHADLFTMSYFLSEVWSFQKEAAAFFEHVFKHAKKGAMFLFIDNNDQKGEFPAWFDSMAKAHGVTVVASNACEMAFSVDEEKKDLDPYYTKFDWPKRKSNVVVRVGIKQ
ncbi:MAG: hypothetical protein JNL50_02610 [Phycisphaerae bacterium]|nr:hypothetical protein [Phycisphaerae bacterium]